MSGGGAAWAAGLERALARSATKRDAAAALGVSPGTVVNHVRRRRPDLAAAWRDLPAGGAFARGGRRLPAPSRSQPEADGLVAEAAADAPPDPGRPQRHNAVLLLLAAFNITGTLSLPRGWTRAAMLALERAGCGRPTAASLRWYRSRLQDDPLAFESLPGADPVLLADIDALYGR